jgi:phosphate transport system protein
MVREQYLRELESVNSDVEKLCDRVCGLLRLSIECVQNWDKKCCAKTIRDERHSRRLFVELEEKCLNIIARQQPVAADLRFITAALVTGRKLERCGSYASEIAQTTKLLKPKIAAGLAELVSLEQTAEEALRLSAHGFVRRDLGLKADIVRLESENDGYMNELLERMKEHVAKSPRSAELAFRTYMIGKYYERAADNALRITHATNYLVTGDRNSLLD